MADIINKVKLPDNITYNIEGSVHYVCGTQTAATGAWTGNLNLPALYDGLTIMYYLPWAGNGNATLNLTLSDGSTTGAKNCYYNTGRLTTHYGKGCNIIMTYHPAGSITVDGTATTDDRWIANANYVDGNNGHNYDRETYTSKKAGSNKIFPYTIIMQLPDERWESIVTSSSYGTSKVKNSHGFLPGRVLLMYSNVTYNENANVGTNIVFDRHSELYDARYSFNVANDATNGFTGYKPIYLVGTITDGLFYLADKWWTQDLPTSADNKVYLYVGDAYDYYRAQFVGGTVVAYKYVNGKLREISSDSLTVNGLTVETAVPANAKFTDDSVTSSAKHYTPATASGQDKTASASGATAAWGIDVVKGVTLNTDGKGHVTGLSVTSGKIPGNPDTDTKVTQTADDSTNSNFECLFSATADNTTRTETSKKSSKLKFNPSTGNLQATQLNGVTIGSSPKFTDTDTKVTAVGNHYTPATVSGQDKTASASGAIAAWDIDVIKGVTLNTDGKGHITGLSVESGKIPSNPNTDIKVRQTLKDNTDNTNRPLLLAYDNSASSTANRDDVCYRTNTIYANPSTGTITATIFDGDATSVNGHTVAKDVPSDALFTDTNNRKSFYGTCSTAATTAAKVVTLSDTDGWELKAGTVVGVKFSIKNTASNVTLNVNNSGNKSIFFDSSVYTGSAEQITGGKDKITYYMYDGNNWCFINRSDNYRDSNSDTYDKNRYKVNILCGNTAIVAKNIIVANSDNKYHHLKDGTAFDIKNPILYANAAIVANATGNDNYDIINFAVETTQAFTMTLYAPVFIKGTLSGTTFTPVSTTPLTQTIPNTADGYYYMLLGVANTAENIYLTEDHRIFAYKNGKFGEIVNDAMSVNGYTVAKSVPSNAVFTDTTYTAQTTSIGSASAGTAIAADDITAWSAGTVPTLGTAIAADDITAWSAGTMFSASVSGKKLTLTAGTAPSLSYTARSIPNVTSVGTAPSLSYTARSIPNISVTSKTVVTGITAN